MPRVRKFRRLADAYTFPGFCPLARIVGMFGDARARLVTLVRRGKNDLRELRHGSPRLVRPPAPARTGSVLRRPAHLPGPRGPARGPIWFGGSDRSEASLDQFYVFAPQAAILFDKFHDPPAGRGARQGQEAPVRPPGYEAPLHQGPEVRPAVAHNLTGSARKNLKLLLSANKRLNTAYLLKESFAQLWDYSSEAWAGQFFENWRAQLLLMGRISTTSTGSLPASPLKHLNQNHHDRDH
jgi:hypothetical protein